MQRVCVMLYRICQAFSKAPHEYLFNDLRDDDVSTKLSIDYAVWNQNNDYEYDLHVAREKAKKRQARRDKLRSG